MYIYTDSPFICTYNIYTWEMPVNINIDYPEIGPNIIVKSCKCVSFSNG